jgi:hypothetical protein
VFHRFTRALVIRVAYPCDIIQHDAIHVFAIKDYLRLIFVFAFNLYRWGQQGSASPIRLVRLEAGHMKDIMDLPYGLPETQSIGLRAYSVYDLKRVVLLVAQLMARPGCAEVFSGQPYSVPHGILSGPCSVVCILPLRLGRLAEHLH